MRRCLWLGPRRKMRHPLAQRAARGPLGRHATPKRLSTFVPSWFRCAAPLRPPAARPAGCDTGAWADLFASSAGRLKRRCTLPHPLAPRCSRAPWQRPRVDRCVPGNNLSRPPPTFAWARPAARGLCSSTAALLWRARPPHGAQGQEALPPSRGGAGRLDLLKPPPSRAGCAHARCGSPKTPRPPAVVCFSAWCSLASLRCALSPPGVGVTSSAAGSRAWPAAASAVKPAQVTRRAIGTTTPAAHQPSAAAIPIANLLQPELQGFSPACARLVVAFHRLRGTGSIYEVSSGNRG